MRFITYTFIAFASVFLIIGCEDDEKDLSVKPLIGFAANAGTLIQTNENGVRVGFYSNVPLTEPTTVKVQVSGGALIYGQDFATEPAPQAGVITVVIDPEDEQPSFFVLPAGTAEGQVSFQIIEVQGSRLGLAQSAALQYSLSVLETEVVVVAPGTVSIASIRARTGTINESIFIEGVIISSNDNVTSKSVYIQDASAAIVLRLVEDNLNAFKRGDRVRVDLSNTSISAFNGLLQVNMPKAKGTVVGTAALPTPRQITVAELNAKTYESQLVRIVGVTFAAANGSVTVSGNTTFGDGSQTAIMRVEPYSPFVGKILPTGTVTLTGIASVFTTGQLIPQVASDIP